MDNEHIAQAANALGQDRERFIENLALVVRTSHAKDFGRIDLLDTPGLVDGMVTYPFNVNRAIVELAKLADLILVFLDPIGQALCSRTSECCCLPGNQFVRAILEVWALQQNGLRFFGAIAVDVVKQLNDGGFHDRMRYYLTKVDTVARREDLNKVLVQGEHRGHPIP